MAPRLHLSWVQLRDQFGSGEARTRSLAQRVWDVLPEIVAVYPEAKVEATRHGLMLRPSLPGWQSRRARRGPPNPEPRQ